MPKPKNPKASLRTCRILDYLDMDFTQTRRTPSGQKRYSATIFGKLRGENLTEDEKDALVIAALCVDITAKAEEQGLVRLLSRGRPRVSFCDGTLQL